MIRLVNAQLRYQSIMKWMLFPTLVISALLAATAVPAQDAASRLDAFFSDLARNQGFSGNLLVAEKGVIIYEKSTGFAEVETRRLNSEATEFQLASVSKIFTAIAVLQLKEQGKIALNDAYSHYFPAFPYKEITLRQLLSHSSGLSDQDLAKTLSDYENKLPAKRLNQEDLIPAIVSGNVPLKLQPGEKWWYCNLGYQLLAYLVQEVSGEPFDQYLKRHIFEPARMEHTYLKTAHCHPNETPDFASNYDYQFRFSDHRRKLEGKDNYYVEALFGHSNIISPARDLLRLDQALYDGRLLKPKSLEEAYSPANLRTGEKVAVWLNIGGMGSAFNGLGWFIFEDNSHGTIVWHSGGMPGCATIFLRNLDKKQTVILLDNANSEGIYSKALSAMNLLNGLPPLPVKSSLMKIYGRALVSNGPDTAFVRLKQFQADTNHYTLTENDLNRLGYDLLEHGYPQQALETFKTTIWLYPQSDNALNSYAEALEAAHQRDEALQMYQRSLELNANNEDSKNAIFRLRAKELK